MCVPLFTRKPTIRRIRRHQKTPEHFLLISNFCSDYSCKNSDLHWARNLWTVGLENYFSLKYISDGQTDLVLVVEISVFGVSLKHDTKTYTGWVSYSSPDGSPTSWFNPSFHSLYLHPSYPVPIPYPSIGFDLFCTSSKFTGKLFYKGFMADTWRD